MPSLKADILALAGVAVVAFASLDTRRPDPPTVRVMTSYVLMGTPSVDTAAATESFVDGLSIDSLVRVLPSLAEPAQFVAAVRVLGSRQRVQAVVRVTSVKTGRIVLTDSAGAGSVDSLGIALRGLGEKTSRRLLDLL